MHLKTETSGIMVWACRMSPGLDCPVARGDRTLRAGIAGSNWRAPAWEAGYGPTSYCQKVPLLAQ